MIRGFVRRAVVLPAFLVLIVAVGSVAFLAQRLPSAAAPDEVAVADLSALQGGPLRVEVPMVNGADRRAQRARFGAADLEIGRPRDERVVVTPVYLVRTPAGEVRAFVGLDPRTGCELVLLAWYHDRCHGSGYDRHDGRWIAGPGPFNLNRLEVTVRDGAVSVHPKRIVIGDCRVCR